MELQPHKDLVKKGKKNTGYAIRIGAKLPANSANLAYVQSKAVSPEENILLEDVASHIEENGLLSFVDTDYMVFPQNDYLLETEDGQSVFPTDTIHITDEFTVRKNRQDTPKPVFYRMQLDGLFDARNAQVLPYAGGYSNGSQQDAISYAEIRPDQRAELLYIGDSIRIELNGGPLELDDVFKTILVREPGSEGTYRVEVITNFLNKKEKTYKVVYPNFSNSTSSSDVKEEVLNAAPFFERITPTSFDQTVKEMEQNPDAYKHKKIFTIKEEKGSFRFYATSDLMIANYQTRPPQMFKHRVEAKLKTKLSETNPGQMNIGFYFVQEAINMESLASVGKVLSEHTAMPAYLEIRNPHPPTLGLMKENVMYWTVDLNMPDHHYEDYDMIIITGYGKKDLSAYKEKFNHYTSNGGTIWIDNAGTGFSVLDFKTVKGNSFIADIGFSTSTNEFGVKELEQKTPYTERLYPITKTNELGYEGVSPSIVFGRNQVVTEWDVLIRHLNGGPSIMKKAINEKGTMIVSNAGLFRSLYYNKQADTNVNFILNAIMYHAEEQWIFTPWRNEFVYHRENLFAQEYKVNNTDVYINDRNDYNAHEIVAKKILHSNISEYVKGFCKPWFYNASGNYTHKIDGDINISVPNGDFESGRVSPLGVTTEKWTADTVNALPSWNTKKLAGGAVTYLHESGISQFGMRQISVASGDATGTHAFWESQNIYLAADRYVLEGWMATEQVAGISSSGARMAIYNLQGQIIGGTFPITGTQDWVRVSASFEVKEPQQVQIRLGFVDGNATGKAIFDKMQLQSAGTVRGVADNEGEKPLYAFSVKPNPSTIDIEAEGFVAADITRATPKINFSYTITPFVLEMFSYGFDETTGNEITRYGRTEGPSISRTVSIQKTDGLMSLGYLHSILPAIPAGRQWYDRNKVFYKITAGSQSLQANDLVNLKLFNRDTGMEWFYSNELIVGHKDIFGGTIRPSYVLHAETNYETIRASKRNFGLKLMDERRIYSELPQTKDAKENWYLRVHNGHFTKEALGYKEWQELYSNKQAPLMEKYAERVMRKELYSVKEYDEQIFNPYIGIKTVENEIEYLTPSTVKVPHDNLHIQNGEMNKEPLIVEGLANRPGTLFRARNTDWIRNDKVEIWLDRLNNGYEEWVDEWFPVEINYLEGTVFFPNQNITGTVYATYEHRNYSLHKRNYKNFRQSNDILRGKISNEVTKETVFYGSKENWLIQPAPILKTSAGKPTATNTIPPTAYRIDYERGKIIFKNEPADTIYADYGYFESERLEVKDFDAQNGIFLLDTNVSFKDDLYAKYSYFDNFYEYKGFYNEALATFMHLDLNPSVGHYSTMPVTSYLNGVEHVEYRNVPSSKLLNKMIHVYIVPTSFGGNSIRHCFSAEEWRIIQRSNPMNLLLAKVQVREHTNVNEVVVMDARQRGGGISERLSTKTIDERIQGKQRYWDIGNWDGKAFYRNGVLIISLPKAILNEYGGTLTQEYVHEIIDKHVAYGTYFIIEWE